MIQDGWRSRRLPPAPSCLPDYDAASLDVIRKELLIRAGGLDTLGMFGRRVDVDPGRHLEGTAGGWGGLPESEAVYIGADPGSPVGEYR